MAAPQNDDEFKACVRKMRSSQKEFFAAQQGSQERRAALIASKKYEAMVDEYLASTPIERMPDLFNQQEEPCQP